MISEKLTPAFINELIAYSLANKNTFEIVKQHLKYSYLQEESEKELWQWLVNQHNKTGRVPTIGQIQQQFINKESILDLLLDISNVDINESESNEDILFSFEKYIKQMMFLDANEKIVETYNRGKKEDSYFLFQKFADDMEKFGIFSSKFERVFEDFNEREVKRKSEEKIRYKVPTMIDDVDYRLGGASGGPETGEFVLWLGDSGSGKSQCLVQVGVSAARQGFRVVHFQLEGTREQCMNRYDACWTGTLYKEVKVGEMSSNKVKGVQNIIKKLSKNDIFVSSEETFLGKSLVDIRRECKEIERKYGHIDVIIIDYLELMEVGDGILYSPRDERFRQTKLSRGCKMLAMEFNAVVHTATQSSNIPYEKKNDPSFVITRDDLSEDKGKIRPADIFITINQTIDEMKEEIIRLHTDKLRDYKSGDPIQICTNFAYSRFYDRKKTLDYDWDSYNNE